MEGAVQWSDMTWPQHWPDIVIPASASMETRDSTEYIVTASGVLQVPYGWVYTH